jgi:hypothetical protein
MLLTRIARPYTDSMMGQDQPKALSAQPTNQIACTDVRISWIRHMTKISSCCASMHIQSAGPSTEFQPAAAGARQPGSKPAEHIPDATPNTYTNKTARQTCCQCIVWHFKCTACYCVPRMANGHCCVHMHIWAHGLHACKEQASMHARAVVCKWPVFSPHVPALLLKEAALHIQLRTGRRGRHASGNRGTIQCQLCRLAACSAATAVSCCMSHCNTLPCQLLLTVVEACGTYKYKVASWQGYLHNKAAAVNTNNSSQYPWLAL